MCLGNNDMRYTIVLVACILNLLKIKDWAKPKYKYSGLVSRVRIKTSSDYIHLMMNIFTKDIVLLQNSLRYLRFLCIWPKNQNEINAIRIFYTRYFLVTISTTILLWGSLAHMIVTLHEKTGASIDLDISITISIIGTYYFNLCFLVNVKKLAGALRDLSDFKRFEKPPGFDAFNSRLNTYSKWHQIYICGAISILCIPQLLERKNCMAKNVEMGLSEICGLVANVWFPFDVDFFPVKQIIYLIQYYSAHFSYATSSTISFSIMESFSHVIFRMSHVKDMFLKAINEKDEFSRRFLLGRCIEYHNFVISTAETLSDSYSPCVFVHVLFTGAILACNAYQLMQGPQLNSISLFVGWFVSLLMVAFVGQRLTDECLELRDMVYNTRWYDLEVKTQKDLILVLVRCKKPLYIKAGAFGVMSYQVVLSILKTSYSILSVMTGTS